MKFVVNKMREENCDNNLKYFKYLRVLITFFFVSRLKSKGKGK
jgi:hypothetical protein